jgi:hypothetical protein
MNIDAQRIALTHPQTRRRRLLRVTAGSAAALAGIALAGRRGTIARARENQALVGSWMVAAVPPGAQPGPARVLVSFTGDGVALRTAPLQQAAPPALGSETMFISTTHGAWAPMDDGAFGLTWVGFAFDQGGKFLATQRVRVLVLLNETLDGFTGPFKTDFIGADGQVVASAGGTVLGTRIQVETPA